MQDNTSCESYFWSDNVILRMSLEIDDNEGAAISTIYAGIICSFIMPIPTSSIASTIMYKLELILFPFIVKSPRVVLF